jgi:hypothetical protein
MTEPANHQASPPVAAAVAKHILTPREQAEAREDAATKKIADAKKAAEAKIAPVTLANADFSTMSPLEALELLRDGIIGKKSPQEAK